jgi:ribose transport system permease protein
LRRPDDDIPATGPAEPGPAPPADHAEQPPNLIQRIADLRAWLFLALLVIGFEAVSRYSFGGSFVLNPYNLQSIAIFAVAPLLLATGQTFVIISGGIDLSTGFIMGLAAVVAAHGTNIFIPSLGPGFAALVGALIAVLVAMVPGWINGMLISRLRVPPFIGTLGMFGVARGTAFLVAGGTTVPVNDAVLAAVGNGRIAGIPYMVAITAVFVLIMHYVLSQTRFGQHNYAIGANEQAARRAGIRIKGHVLRLYILSAACAGLAGVLYAARFTAGAAQPGEPLLLDSVAAVVIGGASLFGGSGVCKPSSGDMLLNGKPVSFTSPQEARDLGIETIYQDLSLADNLSIGANIFLGREPMRRLMGVVPVLDRPKMAAAAKETMALLDFHVTRLDAPVSNFSGGQRQAVAIGRAVFWNAQLLIMDEPTAALGVPEQRKVLALIKQLKEQGRGVIFISHNLQDIFAVADRVIVLRRGIEAGERKISETSQDEIVKLMIGG